MKTKSIILLLIPLLILITALAGVFAAEVAIDSAVNTNPISYNGSSPTVVFTSDQTGYAFFRDSDGSCVYSKTTNGGASWGAAVTVDAQTDCLGMAVWYDQWTPGDITGAYIHIVTMDNADLWYARLNVSGDALTTVVNASGANQGGGFALGQNVPSITKGTDGDIYMGTQDNGDSFVIKCATGADCASALNWTEAGANPFDLASDWLILMPLSGGNILAIRFDTSADDVQSKVYTDSTNSWDAAWTTIDANALGEATYDSNFGATLKKSTGDIYLAYAADIAAFGTDDDIRAAVYAGGAWTAKTNVLTNDTKGVTGAKISFDETNSEVYAVYTARATAGTGSTGNVYWKKSSDGMASWGAEQGPVNATAGDLYGMRVNAMSTERIYATWDLTSVDDLMGNTVADITASDTTAPADISNLAIGSPGQTSMPLTWTAPGDDGSTGTATTYDIRYSTSIITSGNFSSATQVSGEPTPSVAGSGESMTVTGLSASATYFFAIKTSDEVPNTSGISNVPSGTTAATPDTTAPAAVSDLTASNAAASSMDISWTAPGDDGSTGTATSYDLRYSTSVITDGNFSSATQVSGEPTPSVAGSGESMTVSGLSAGTVYYFALKTSDETPNTSGISNVPSGTTSAGGGSSPPPPSDGSGGGGSNPPRRVIFSGQAYPQSKIEVLRKLVEDETYIVAPTESSVMSEDGSFVITVAGLIRANYLFALQAYDKDGRSSGILVFSAPFYVDQPDDLIEFKNILFPPTMAFEKALITKSDNLKIKGYASPNNMVELEVDGAKYREVRAAQSGFYSFDVSIVSFAYGEHRAQTRQIASDGRKSGFSTLRVFQISNQPTLQTDFNNDGKVNITDWSIFLFQWGSDSEEIRLKNDLNGDGRADIFDFSIFLKAMTI